MFHREIISPKLLIILRMDGGGVVLRGKRTGMRHNWPVSLTGAIPTQKLQRLPESFSKQFCSGVH